MQSLIEQFQHNNFLITTSEWFTAPDGKMYRAVWGSVKVFKDEDTLGVKTNHQSTNWYAVVGKIDVPESKAVVIAGCQIKYACVCMEKPNTDNISEIRISNENAKTFDAEREGIIYLAQ